MIIIEVNGLDKKKFSVKIFVQYKNFWIRYKKAKKGFKIEN